MIHAFIHRTNMKHYEFRELGDGEHFDPTLIFAPTPFTQADFYGSWQKSLKREVKRFLVLSRGEVVAYFQLIRYPLLRGKSYFYIPYGPVTKDFSSDFFVSLKEELIRIAKEQDVVFIRLDFTPFVPSEVLSQFFKKAPLYTYHSAHFQPRYEWFLKLDKTEEELLHGMHKNTRYDIRLAEKKGVGIEIVKEDFENYFEIFYDLMEETAKRNGFGLHEKKYYKNIFSSLHQTKNSFLSVARYQGKILVIDLIVVFGRVANHVFGGSSNEYRALCPSYLSKQAAILYAKKLGCSDFNFGGISTIAVQYEEWEDLTLMKKRFGGREERHSDFFDIIFQPFWYFLYSVKKRIVPVLSVPVPKLPWRLRH